MNITAGIFKGQKISAPDEKITRPTLSKVRMSVFNTLQAMMDFSGCSFLDMYAGSGIIGLEALSRGFSYAAAIEKHPKIFSVIKSNYKKFSSHPDLFCGDALKTVEKINKTFDVIFIDPPYFSGIYESSLEAVKPYAAGIVVLEHVVEFEINGYDIIKQKKYGEKYVTFLKVQVL